MSAKCFSRKAEGVAWLLLGSESLFLRSGHGQVTNVLVLLVVVYSLSQVTLLRPHGLYPARLLWPWDSPGKNTGVGCHFLLQGTFQTQESNLGILHCRQVLYRWSYEGSPQSLQFSSVQSLSRVQLFETS